MISIVFPILFAGFLSGDAVYVHTDKGSTEASCGAKRTPCKYLTQGVINCMDGGVIYLQGLHTLRSQIQITKNVSIVGNPETTLKGATADLIAFEISQSLIFHLRNVIFKETAIISILNVKAVIQVTNCSVYGAKHHYFPIHFPTLSKTQNVFNFRPGANGVLAVFNSTFIGWRRGFIMKVTKEAQLSDSKFVFEGCTFIDYRGIYLIPVANVVLKIKNCLFYNASCCAIYMESVGDHHDGAHRFVALTITNSSFIYSRGIDGDAGLGGASGAVTIFSIYSIHIYGCEFKNCTTAQNSQGRGGAISINNSFRRTFVMIQRNVFEGNVAHGEGGDIFIANIRRAFIRNCTFMNSRANEGGSIGFTFSNVTLSNCVFTENSATANGGAVSGSEERKSSTSSIIFRNCTFTRNKAFANGGAIMVETSGELQIRLCHFNENRANMGGGIMLKLEESPADGTHAIVHTSIFKDNMATVGGGAYLKQTTNKFQPWNKFYSIMIYGCVLKGNSATSSGQSIYSNSHIAIQDTKVVTLEKYIGFHLSLENGYISLSNITVQLLRDYQYRLPPKSRGIVFKSKEIKLSRGLRFLCPKNFNLDEMKNTSQLRLNRFVLLRMGAKPGKQTVYTSFSVGCIACPYAEYSLQSGHLYIARFSKKYPPENLITVETSKCMRCPTGGICDVHVKAVDNFWGYADASTISFKLCPQGFCCGSDTVPCTTYDTCAVGRSGKLCGTCARGYKQNFIGSDCIPKDKECNAKGFVIYSIAYVFGYTALICLITNVKDIIMFIKSFLSKINSSMDTEATECDEENLSITGFAHATILFFQVAGLLKVKFQGGKQTKDSTSSEEVRKRISEFFEFRFTIYQRLCPSDDLTRPQKELILFGIKLATILLLFFFLIVCKVSKVSKNFLHCRNTQVFGKRRVPTEERSMAMTSDKAEDDPMEPSGLPEIPFTMLSFVNMLKCTVIKLLKLYYTPVTKSSLTMVHCVQIFGEYRLYVYGDHVCYCGWQIGIILILLPCLMMFPICFEMAIRLLKDNQISSMQFVCAVACPYYAVLLWVWKRMHRQAKMDSASHHVPDEEKNFRRTILVGEEMLFKQSEGSLSWQIIQFYRTFAITVLNTFITNPIYRLIAYIIVLLMFVVHDHRRKPYKNQYLNMLQSLSSICLIIVLACNVIPSISYMVNIQAVPFISDIVKLLGVVELIVYAVVPLSLPVWHAKNYFKSIRK